MFEKQYDDAVLVAEYLKYHSQNKAAEALGCSRETVARAVRRAGIPLNGRRNNGDHKGNYGGGSPRKITDEEVIEEAKTMSCAEIAFAHGMHYSNVERKLKRLGIEAKPGVGGTTSKWKQRTSNPSGEYDTSITLYAVIRKYNGVCQICGERVNVHARNGRRIGGDYPSIDHIVPVSQGGEHTWANVQLAHMKCNAQKGA